MIRKILMFVLSTLVGLLFVQSAYAQYRYRPFRPADLPYRGGPLQGRGGGVVYETLYGYIPGGDGYYPGGYATEGPIGRRERTIETTAACAAIGAGVGGLKGLLIGAGSCLAGNVIYDVTSGRRVRKLHEQEARAFQAQAEQEERAHQTAVAQQAEAEQRVARATRWLFNRSGQQAVVTDGGHPLCNSGHCFMRPNESWQVDRPASGQWSVVLSVPKGAGMINLPGEVRSLGSRGWEITAPQGVQ